MGYTANTTLYIKYTAKRTDPDTDALRGYFPCDIFKNETEGYPITPPLGLGAGSFNEPIDNPCGPAGPKPNPDVTPATITLTSIYNTLPENGVTNSLSIQARIEDDRRMGSARLQYADGSVEMEGVDVNGIGNGLYEAIVENVEVMKPFEFTIGAIDAAGNVATKTYRYFNGQITELGMYPALCFGCGGYPSPYGYVGSGQEYRMFAGNPVVTQNGNKVEELNLLSCPGPGGAAIDIQLTINGQSTLKGYFGSAVTSALDMSLGIFHNKLFDGARVTYPGGGIADFARIGDCQFKPVSKGAYDRFECAEGGGYRLTTTSLTVYEFNSLGQLTAVGDPDGNKVMIQYDGNGRPVSMISTTGRSVQFTYNADGLIEQVNGSGGKSVQLTYTSARLDSITDANGGIWRFEYEERPFGTMWDSKGQEYDLTWTLLKSVTTPEGRVKNVQEFDQKGRVTSQNIGVNETRQFIYDDVNHTTTIIDVNGYQEIHQYDAQGRILSRRDGAGYIETYTYTAYIVTGYTNQKGQQWTYTADERGNRTGITGPEGLNETYQYNALNQVTYYRDSEGRETFYEYDSAGNILKIRNAAGFEQTFSYNAQGQITRIVDFAGRVTTFAYNTNGDLVSTSDGLQNTTTFSYDSVGRQISMTYPNGNTFNTSYDQNDQVIRVDGPLGWHEEYRYDADGNLTEIIDAHGESTTNTFDASGHLIKVCDAEARCVNYTYESMGHLLSITDPKGRVTSFEMDERYKVTVTHLPNNVVIHTMIDEVGLPVAESDALNHVSLMTYDGLHRLTSLTENYIAGQPQSSDVNIITTFTYDKAGNVVATTDARGNTTTMRYNALDQRITSVDALGHDTTFSYTPLGDLLEIRNPRGFATQYRYDAAGRLSSIINARNEMTNYGYDGNGNLTSLQNGRGITTRFEFDELNRLVKHIKNYRPNAAAASDTNVATTYRYDLLGNVVEETDARGFVARYQYNKVSELVAMTNRVGAHTEFTLDATGNITSVKDANGYLSGFVFDNYDRVIESINQEGHRQKFSYDANGNMISRTNERGFTEILSYDALNRLVTKQDYGGNTWRYKFDRVGNLKSVTDPNLNTVRYRYNAVYNLMRVTDAAGVPTLYRYDANNNLVRIVDRELHETHFGYDKLDRRNWEQDALGRLTSFEYDAMSNLTASIAPDGIRTVYEFDALDRLSAVTENFQPTQSPSSNVNVRSAYLYTPTDEMATFINPNNAQTHFEYDGQGRLIRETDALGKTWDYSYDPMNNLKTRRDANGVLTEYQYYPDNQLFSVRYPNNTGYTFTYDETNNRLTMEHVGQALSTATWTYDPLNRVTAHQDALGRTIGMIYDPVGNRTGLIHPEGQTISYNYDTNNWLKAVNIPGQGRTRYVRDHEGHITQIINPNNTRTEMGYDQAYQLTDIKNFAPNRRQPMISQTSYKYDLAGMRVRATNHYGWRQDERVRTNYRYDGLRRLIRSRSSEAIVSTYAYDAAGNRLRWTTNDDPMTNKPRDGFNELFVYNAANQLTSANRLYDMGFVPLPTETPEIEETETPVNPTATYTLEITPDLTDEVDITPTAFETATYTPTFVPTEIFTETPTETWTPSPTETPIPTLTALRSSVDTYCTAGLVGSVCEPLQQHVDQAIQYETAADYDALLNHLQLFIDFVTLQRGDQIDTVAADDLIAQANFLISYYTGLSGSSSSSGAQFMPISYVERQTLPLPTAIEDGQLNQGSGKGNNPNSYTAIFQYDSNGSRIDSLYTYGNGQQRGTAYTYDFERRLVEVNDYKIVGQGSNQQDKGITNYVYDGMGTRLRDTFRNQQNSNAEVHEYLNDGWDIIAEYDLQTGHTTQYYRGDNQQLISRHDLHGKVGNDIWYHHDGLGSITGLSKHDGQAVHNYRYADYGNITPKNGNFTEPHNVFTYTGKTWDSITGLYFFGARYYDPATANWLNQDYYKGDFINPVSMHRYLYGHSNPINWVDWYGFLVLTQEEIEKRVQSGRQALISPDQVKSEPDDLNKHFYTIPEDFDVWFEVEEELDPLTRLFGNPEQYGIQHLPKGTYYMSQSRYGGNWLRTARAVKSNKDQPTVCSTSDILWANSNFYDPDDKSRVEKFANSKELKFDFKHDEAKYSELSTRESNLVGGADIKFVLRQTSDTELVGEATVEVSGIFGYSDKMKYKIVVRQKTTVADEVLKSRENLTSQ